MDPEQRSRLYAAKLRALVEARWPTAVDGPARVAAPFGGGAASVAGRRAWVLLDGTDHGIGSVLAWARSNAIDDLDVLVGEHLDAGVVARQASHFRDAPRVWRVDGTALVETPPVDRAPPPVPSEAILAQVDLLERAGLDVVVDHGVVSGEILGLEVARVVATDDGVARVEVGVGRTDREAFAVVHGDLPVDAALRSVVDTVRGHRRPDAPVHPLNRLAGERWLRSHLIQDPDRLPGWSLVAVEGPIPRGSVNDVVPAIAVGSDAEGRPVVVACSVGIDLEVVPLAAEARDAHDPDARLVIALPARDAIEVTRALAGRLRQPADLLPIEGDWRR